MYRYALSFHFHNGYGSLQKQIDQFVAGTIGVTGQLVKLCDQLILHADGHNLVSVISVLW